MEKLRACPCRHVRLSCVYRRRESGVAPDLQTVQHAHLAWQDEPAPAKEDDYPLSEPMEARVQGCVGSDQGLRGQVRILRAGIYGLGFLDGGVVPILGCRVLVATCSFSDVFGCYRPWVYTQPEQKNALQHI